LHAGEEEEDFEAMLNDCAQDLDKKLDLNDQKKP